ncbi:MAG TPA: hypothetical protein PK156_17150 [Polyangium sp.]|nr:hypothetical protein [Polyangium sp.]
MYSKVYMGIISAFISGLLVVGCGSDPAEKTQEDELASSKGVCAYDPFNAVVREGPSAGLAASGALTLIEEMDGSLRGKLENTDAQGIKTTIPVTGSVKGKTIDLVFTLADGGQIKGTGTLAKPFEECAEPMEGTLTGPLAGDKGDWDGYGSRCFNDCRLIGGGFYECLVGCSLFY